MAKRPNDEEIRLGTDPEFAFLRRLAPAIDDIISRHGVFLGTRYSGPQEVAVGRVADMTPGRVLARRNAMRSAIGAARVALGIPSSSTAADALAIAAGTHCAAAMEHSLLSEARGELAHLDRLLSSHQSRFKSSANALDYAEASLSRKAESVNRHTVAYVAPWAVAALHTFIHAERLADAGVPDPRPVVGDRLTAVQMVMRKGAPGVSERRFYRRVAAPVLAEAINLMDERLAALDHEGPALVTRLRRTERLAEMESTVDSLLQVRKEIETVWRLALALESADERSHFLLLRNADRMEAEQFEQYVNQVADAGAGRITTTPSRTELT